MSYGYVNNMVGIMVGMSRYIYIQYKNVDFSMSGGYDIQAKLIGR